ncbi:MAG: sensor histidine kinase [Pseudomonadales bacterium]
MSLATYGLHHWSEIQRDAERSSKYANEFAQVLGMFCLVAFPLSFFIEQFLAPDSYNTLAIRIVSALVCTGFLFFSKLRLKSESVAAAYWVLALGIAGIYSFTSMLLLNAAFAVGDTAHITIWVFQYIVALSLVIQLLSSWRLSIAVWIVGSALSFANLVWIENPNWEAITNYVFIPAPIYASAIFVGALAARYTNIIQLEKLETASAIGANIAHEIRTPLAGIRGFANGLTNLLPDLTEGYLKAREAGLVGSTISDRQLNQVGDVANSIKREVEYSNTVIDMLLVATAQTSFANSHEQVSAAKSATEAIRRFPFSNDVERRMFELEIAKDFSVSAPALIVIHILFNLMKNAIRYAMASKEKRILITVGKIGEQNSITIRDSGSGVPAGQRTQIFERFYTTSTSGLGSGIGLSFCKTAIESIGGSIRCESDGHSFTEFQLTFPCDAD